MLYVTTRNNADAYTPQRILTIKRGPDGGLFIPYRIPQFTQQEIESLSHKSFNANLADTMNLLFGSHLTSFDIDLAIGRSCVRLQQLGQRIIMGECWHNTDWQFSRMIRDLSAMVLTEKNTEVELGGWVQTGVRISVLFGIFGELIREDLAGPTKTVDISMISGDFFAPISAWYARTMGLPIGNIVCCVNENAALWDFICHGILRTDATAIKTAIREADIVVPEALECLISLYGGPAEVKRYVDTLHMGNTYYVEDGLLHRMRQGIYVTVSSETRILTTIPSAYATHRYLLGPAAALAYAGLQDYRSRTGEMRNALIMTEKSPSHDLEVISSVMGISVESLKEYFK